ncbi:hypothetical protein D3C80_1498620 [compost metagenome]
MRLDLQRPQRLHGEGQLHTPQLLLGFVFFATFLWLLFFGGVFALELDLQGHDVLHIAHRDFQLPGAHQPSVGGYAGLFQARQLMALQA